ncbi:MAG: MBOAT family O-acyltransferase [Acidobacteriota bacterium]
MVFDSAVFLFLFLPSVLALTWAAPVRARNLLLLAASLFFYAWGDAPSLPVLIFSILMNHALGILTGNATSERTRKSLLILAVCLNLGLLLYFKYFRFIVFNLGAAGLLDPDQFSFEGWRLPLGISFFTFSALAYQIDSFRGKILPEKNLVRFGLYVAHFAKIIAGPIVRFQEISLASEARRVTIDGFAHGIRRFLIGFGKKMLVANPAATFADAAFSRTDGLDMPTAWLGIACYTIQIYFDFSGYSDMAIGLGRMFGFTFTENFNYPYVSQSIQEFWRRWHISLSRWFRDYLYIPLGGNRVSEARIYLNLVIVFLLCGLWHGASWNFVAWGAYHGIFLALERAGLGQALRSAWRPVRHIYALAAIMVGWVFFRADSLTHAFQYLQAMFSFSGHAFEYYRMTFINKQFLLMLAAGTIGATPVLGLADRLRSGIEHKLDATALDRYDLISSTASALCLIVLAVASAMQLASSTFTPFIYTKF